MADKLDLDLKALERLCPELAEILARKRSITWDVLKSIVACILRLGEENETWKGKYGKLLSRIHKLEDGFMEYLNSKEPARKGRSNE